MLRSFHDRHVYHQTNARDASVKPFRAGQVSHSSPAPNHSALTINQDYASRQPHLSIRRHLLPLHLLPLSGSLYPALAPRL